MRAPLGIGPLGICIACGSVLLFAEDLSLRRPSTEELTELRASKDWPAIQRMIRATIRAKKNQS